ncbi:MAG: flagellar hook-associated protein FlgK [Chloroflexota bacterium]
MTPPFFGLDIASRALRTQQTLVDITNQNVANANTPGYSRQSGDVEATLAYPIPAFNATGRPGQLGTGVEVTQVTRARDAFNDLQMREQLSSQGKWTARQDALTQVESTINEPSTTGLSSLMSKYWKSWQEVANSPADASVRTSLIEQGKALANGFVNTRSQLVQQQRDLDAQVGLTVTSINNDATQIANLNKQISQVETSGLKANDLRDQRDKLLDDLSGLVKITTVDSSEGSVNVFIGSHQLVDRVQAHTMSVDNSSGVNVPTWTDVTPNAPVTLTDGKLEGLVEARDTVLGGPQGQIARLDSIASNLITSVNGLHTTGIGRTGSTSTAFFTGTNAASIAVNTAFDATNGTDLVAAAKSYIDPNTGTSTYASGDGSNAAALAELQNAGSPTIGEQYRQMVADLGVNSQAAQGQVANQKVLVDHLTQQRQQTSGVSLDEEATHLIAYQRAYQAAARVITVMDSMLDTLINNTGRVGR